MMMSALEEEELSLIAFFAVRDEARGALPPKAPRPRARADWDLLCCRREGAKIGSRASCFTLSRKKEEKKGRRKRGGGGEKRSDEGRGSRLGRKKI